MAQKSGFEEYVDPLINTPQIETCEDPALANFINSAKNKLDSANNKIEKGKANTDQSHQLQENANTNIQQASANIQAISNWLEALKSRIGKQHDVGEDNIENTTEDYEIDY